jgi:vancomycin resistance protein YoaR
VTDDSATPPDQLPDAGQASGATGAPRDDLPPPPGAPPPADSPWSDPWSAVGSTPSPSTPPAAPPPPPPAPPAPAEETWASPGFAIPFRGEAAPAPDQPPAPTTPTWPPVPAAAASPDPNAPASSAADQRPEPPAASDGPVASPPADESPATPPAAQVEQPTEAPADGAGAPDASTPGDPAPPTPEPAVEAQAAAGGEPPATPAEQPTATEAAAAAPVAEAPAAPTSEPRGDEARADETTAEAPGPPPAPASATEAIPATETPADTAPPEQPVAGAEPEAPAASEAGLASTAAPADGTEAAPAGEKLFDEAASPWQGPSAGTFGVDPLAAWTKPADGGAAPGAGEAPAAASPAAPAPTPSGEYPPPTEATPAPPPPPLSAGAVLPPLTTPAAPVPSGDYPPPDGPIFRLPEAGPSGEAPPDPAAGNGRDGAYGAGDATQVEGAAAMAVAPGWAPPDRRPKITPPAGMTHVGEDDQRDGELPEMPRHSAPAAGAGGSRRRVALLAGVPIALLVVVLLAWAVDSARASGKVSRGVEVAGHDVGGLKEGGVEDVVASIAEDTATRKVVITSGDKAYESTAGELGLTVDTEATTTAILDESGGNPIAWVQSFFSTSDVPVRYEVNEGAVALKLVELQGADLTAPAEPTVALAASGEFTATPGRAGSGVDTDEVVAELPEAAATDDPDATIEIDAPPTDVTPKFSDEEAQALATRGNEMTADGLTLKADETTVQVEPAQLRSWVIQAPDAEGDELRLAIDSGKVNTDLPALFEASGLSSEPVDATVTLQNGAPVVVPGKNGVSCCGEDAPTLVWTALNEGTAEVALEATVVEPELTTEEANALGIKEPVGGSRGFQSGSEIAGPGPGFTTYHDPGQPRVTNIHRMADIVRGTLVLPGETFSINDKVGQRTTAKGFVPAGAISQGHHVDEVGGGVSQFATTTFNAAYFAGVDITEYQAHSEYFSRYPPGREATMGYPSPDLKFVNDTPYGILVWTSYTDSSLTVTLYSTPYGQAEQTNKVESMSDQCRVVTTTRTITFPDGHKTTDQFKATYRPSAGVGCNGQPLAPPPEG